MYDQFTFQICKSLKSHIPQVKRAVSLVNADGHLLSSSGVCVGMYRLTINILTLSAQRMENNSKTS